LRRTLNLGILAHVDAGKTTLTERLLYTAGVIDEIGSVDAGTTQTDSMDLERQRGITIRSAVVSFVIDEVLVNLIDTPGHPDFIAEVERVLSVLDGAVLVISSVEGVQPQTRVLMRALQRLRVPTLLFVNKIDRGGADPERVLKAIESRLTPHVVPMGTVKNAGARDASFQPWGEHDAPLRTRLAEVLTAHNDALLADYVNNEAGLTYGHLRKQLAVQTQQALVHPVFFGSAFLGAGTEPLMEGLVELLPALAGNARGPVSGRVFKVERGAAGQKVAYIRMFSGTIQVRDRLEVAREVDAKVTAINTFKDGGWARDGSVSAGEIAKLWGLNEIRVGDGVGELSAQGERHLFAPPTLETVVAPVRPQDKGKLRAALLQLAEQDPLINVRQDDTRNEISVSLYGEVQKEVIQATLASDYGIDVGFHETTTICVERPAGVGEAVELLHGDGNPFLATIGLRIEPGPHDTGIDFRLAVDIRTIPLYVYKNMSSFGEAMSQSVRRTLEEGLHGWQVTDCIVTMFESNYSSPDGPPATRGPLSTAADFRKLTPIVAMRALDAAGSVVNEPRVRVSLEVPTAAIGPVLTALARLGAAVEAQSLQGDLSTIETVMAASRAQEMLRQLPALTGGEGVLESQFAGYQPVVGEPPVRRRTTANPLNREEFLMYLARQGAKG